MSMLSLIMQSPDNSKQSHGTWVRDGSETSNTSPGTRSTDETVRPVYSMSSRSMCKKPFSTYKIRSVEPVHCTRNGKLLSGVPLSSQFSHLINTILIVNAYRACLKYSCSNTEDGNEENADSIVVILVHGPQGQACNLEDVERMKHLNVIVSQEYAMLNKLNSYLVD